MVASKVKGSTRETPSVQPFMDEQKPFPSKQRRTQWMQSRNAKVAMERQMRAIFESQGLPVESRVTAHGSSIRSRPIS